MKPTTEKLWAAQDRHPGDRLGLFSAVAGHVDAVRVLYPGSFVDVAPSFVFPEVTYVDVDRRAATFFSDVDGVQEIVAANQVGPGARTIEFVAGDYQSDLGLADGAHDLLISLYAGFVSEHCTHHLRIGGTLLVNASHGDAAMASIDPRYELVAVVTAGGGAGYEIRTDDLAGYLVAKKPQSITVASLHRLGRGIAYTRSPFAYLFERRS